MNRRLPNRERLALGVALLAATGCADSAPSASQPDIEPPLLTVLRAAVERYDGPKTVMGVTPDVARGTSESLYIPPLYSDEDVDESASAELAKAVAAIDGVVLCERERPSFYGCKGYPEVVAVLAFSAPVQTDDHLRLVVEYREYESAQRRQSWATYQVEVDPASRSITRFEPVSSGN